MANEPLFGFNLQQKKSLMDYLASQGGSTTVTSAQITDATTVGRNVLTAATAAAALSAVGGLSPTGNGSGLTALNASNITTGTLAGARLPTPTSSVRGGVLQASAKADLTAAPTQQDINDILARLRTAGVIAP